MKGLLERCTPGPWKWFQGNRGFYGADGSYVCSIVGHRSSKAWERQQHNAALIALAPSMAKELVELAGENARLRADVAEWECLDAEAKHGAEEMTARATAAEKALSEIAEIASDTSNYGTFTDRLRRIASLATPTP